MQLKSSLALAAAALSAQVAAEFIVLTDIPQALQTLNPEQAASYYASILPGVQSNLEELATDTSYINAATSILPELLEWAATATVSLPEHVTDLSSLSIYTTVPAWYSELPEGVRSLYEDVGQRVESFLSANVPVNATASPSGTPSGTPAANSTLPIAGTGSPTASAPPENTGGAGKKEIGAMMGVAAGLVGVFVM